MKKIAILCLALVMALGSLGVAYAAWAETLTIDGTVNTGNVDVEWTLVGYGDNEPEGKDYSYVTAWICGAGNLHVTITNAYPCITYYVDFGIHNAGTIPVNFLDFVIYDGTMPAEATITLDPVTFPQLHPGFTSPTGRLTVHLGSDAAELTAYTFTVSIVAHQWNLVP